ncbi:MAG: hypothetical protein ACR2O0_13825, partial [Rhizobiaceae bacterium]
MTREVLTDRKINSLKPAELGRRYDVLDALVPGFGVRVTDKGSKSYFLMGRFPSAKVKERKSDKYGFVRPSRRTIGKYK